MAADTSGRPKYKIVVIPADENGCRFYLEQYKPFRLASLQQDAQGTLHLKDEHDEHNSKHIHAPLAHRYYRRPTRQCPNTDMRG